MTIDINVYTIASASNAKKKYCQKFWTENANVGRVSCQRHKAYMISNDPVVKPNKIRSRVSRGVKQPLQDEKSDQQSKIDRQD